MAEEHKTPLYDIHRRLSARLVPYAGWSMPIQYAGIRVEHQAVREAAGLFDVCHMGRLWLTGCDALAAIQYLVTNDIVRVSDGAAAYTCCCNDRGGVLDDLIVYRKSSEAILVVCNAANRDKIVAHFRERIAARFANGCHLDDASEATGLLALQGPAALKILRIAGCSVDVAQQLQRFAWGPADIAGVPCTIARTGYTGEDGVELMADHGRIPELWEALVAAGRDQGLQPAGLGARDTLRLEACLPLYGNELDETTHPYEARLGWTVKLQAGQFVGRDFLVEARAKGASRKLVGLEMVGRGQSRRGDEVITSAGESCGRCTSGAPSPTLGKGIALAYVREEQSAPGTQLATLFRDRTVAVKVVATPFYRRAAAS